MRRQALAPLSAAALAALALSPLAPAAPGGDGGAQPLTLEQTAGRGAPVRFDTPAPDWAWASDGCRLVHETPDGARLVDPATWEESPAGPDEEAALGHARPGRRDLAAPPVPARADGAPDLGRPRGTSADGATTLYVHDGLWVVREDLGARQLTEDPSDELAQLSPDGSHVAFVRGNDLWVAAVDGALERVTEDGGEKRLNGKLDWVYQEEIYGRYDFRGFWWSPDSKRLAFLALDESPVRDFTLVDNIEPDDFRDHAEVLHYPKAGDPNPLIALRVADVATGEVHDVDLAAYAKLQPLVVRVGWTPDGSHLYYVVQDRDQTRADLVVQDPATGTARTWIEERSKTWVERPDDPRWLEDGSFLWASDRTGQHHLYRYGADGALTGPVTQGDWSVRSIVALDEERGLLWFTGTKDGAVDTNVYRVGLDGKGLVRLTQGPGTHSVAFSADRSRFLDTVSTISSPPEVRLCSGDGELEKVLGRSEVAADRPLATWELVQIPARDGFQLDAAVLRPVPFDEATPHPVWISTYSGPDAPTVRDAWSPSAWDQFLAQNGVIVFEVNVRSASGKGPWATTQCYRHLGVQELADLEDAVDWLTAEPWADAARVGITGYSYGGFMTAFALTHSDKFALGIAGGGVYDWRMYDTIYTERYMCTPAENPEGYTASSVLAAAASLHGHLLIEHSEMDDNVHMQNALQLALALQRADRPFEMMIYPQQRHGLRDPAQRWFSRQREWEEIQKVLLDGAQG